MKNNEQNVSVAQKSSDLKLLLHNGPTDNISFKTFHSMEMSRGNWEIGIDIIGESHKINIVNSLAPSSINEVLACLPLDNQLSPSSYMESLAQIEAGKLERNLEGFNYRFSFEKIGFSEERYSETLLSLTEGAQHCISYDFSKSHKDSFDDVFGPVTLVRADVTDEEVKWASLHIYPNDEVAIISKSAISTRE